MTIIDPLKFAAKFWPDVLFSQEQRDTIYSVMNNDETFVPAGNMLGKDFVAAFIVLWYFLSRTPCKILTTSVKEAHLDVLWGEIDKFVRICKYPLEAENGGPLLIGARKIQKVVDGRVHKGSYIIRAVANEKSRQSFQGHHVTPDPGQPTDDIPRNLFVCDESSGVPQMYWDMVTPWAKRIYAFGNTWSCNNFFRWAVEGTPDGKDKGGNVPRRFGGGFHRYVIPITAEDSPNVQYGLEQVRLGIEPTNETIIPGMISYMEYLKRREMWPEQRQCVSLDAKWWKGAGVFMYPEEWLNRAARLAEAFAGIRPKTMGVDSAMGGDKTAWAIAGDQGLVDLIAERTPNTAVIVPKTLDLIKKHGIRPENVLFDGGGGGKPHADRLREMGHEVQVIMFGGSPTPQRRLGMKPLKQRNLDEEDRQVYKNRRVEMYGVLMNRLDPAMGDGFGIPARFHELRRQLAPIPRDYDGEGKLILPPKNRPVTATREESKVVTMGDLIGCSPDEADAVVLAVFGLEYGGTPAAVGRAF